MSDSQIFKFIKKNKLYIIWFVINFFSCWSMLGGGSRWFWILLFIYAVSILIALTPRGEQLMRIIESARPVLTRQELEYLTPIFEDTYRSVKAKNPKLRYVELYLQDIMTVNAFAIGKHTIVLTKGAVEAFSEEELKGVLSHEFGHILNGDTIAVLLNTIGNGIFAIFVYLFRLIILSIDTLAGAVDKSGVARGLCNFIKFILELMIMLFMFWGQVLLSANSRKNEFEADRFAYTVGYGAELVDALYLLQKMSLSEKMTISERIQANHPILAWRINKVEALLDGED